jgi:hypothetical protein
MNSLDIIGSLKSALVKRIPQAPMNLLDIVGSLEFSSTVKILETATHSLKTAESLKSSFILTPEALMNLLDTIEVKSSVIDSL